ncbi:MAG: hypothetical protein PHV34_21730 [Verrucomicrobiae bacterium]|nr:hypothetical protein [Verrucomicrobiae bacterium]
MRQISRKTDAGTGNARWMRAAHGGMTLFFALAAATMAQDDDDAPAKAKAPAAAVKSSVQTPGLDALLNPKGTTAVGQNMPSGVAALPGFGVAEQEALKEKIKSLNSLTSPGFDNPVVRARFEKYLNAPAADANDLARYKELVKKAQDHLLRREDKAAWQVLFELSKFEWDAGISQALAGRVEATWDMKLSNAELDAKIERLKKEMESANWNMDVMSQPKLVTSGEHARSVPGGKQGVPARTTGGGTVNADNVPFMEGKMRAMGEYLKVVEGRAKIKVAEVKTDAIELKNKTDFQEYIAGLFTARRHVQTVLAADFFRHLYGGGDYPASMASQVNTAKEVIRDVEQAVTVFKYKLGHNELTGATEHLLNAFTASEFHTAMLGLDRESKRRIQNFGFQLVKLQSALEARDFTSVDNLIKELQKLATDFDATKPRSIVEAVKLESKMHLGNAKLAAQQGDLKTAMSEFRSAAQIWPGNPDLDMAQLGFFNSQDTKNQFQQEFDRLFEAKNYRAIFDKQLALATALVNDAKRADLLKQALEKVKSVETAIEKARLFQRNGNAFGAWEALELIAREWPDDSTLNKMRAELSAESAAFVHQIKKGEEAEKNGSTGYSLACYLNAQRLYPTSEIAKAAVERLSHRILKK